MWFKNLVGFEEENPVQVRKNLQVEDGLLISKVNGRTFQMGTLEIPSLNDLRARKEIPEVSHSKIQVSEIIGDVQQFHTLSINDGAVFQAASQFNLLEMVGPQVIPERGIDGYESDLTQGPACAIACGAGTIYRNYFVPLNGRIGQSHDNQIDCMSDLAKHLKNDQLCLWTMQNGYAMLKQSGILYLNKYLAELSTSRYEDLKGYLKVGIQKDTEVTVGNSSNLVTQVYCSALPVAYSNIDSIYWERFARLILEATYEATFLAAIENFKKTGNNLLYLTLVGGGAFSNEDHWITSSLKKVIDQFRSFPMDVKIVSYGQSNSALKTFID